MAVSKRLRFEILRRDNHACRYCGSSPTEAELTVDHVIPVALGGTDAPTNLVAACQACNAGKSATAPDQALVDGVTDDAIRWSRAMQLAADNARRQRAEAADQFAKDVETFDRVWIGWKDNDKQPIPRDEHWRDSLSNWLAAGLDLDTLTELVTYTMNRRGLPNEAAWRYFCKCAWNTLTQRQDEARELIAQGAI